MQQFTGSLELTTDVSEISTTEIGEDDLPSRAVVEIIAGTEDVEQTDLPPLYDAIDPDALDALFEPRPRGDGDRTPAEVQFSYYGYEIYVSATVVAISEQ